jgi:hypothetical protein
MIKIATTFWKLSRTQNLGGTITGNEKEWMLKEREALLSNTFTLLPKDSCDVKIYGNGTMATLVKKNSEIITIGNNFKIYQRFLEVKLFNFITFITTYRKERKN